MAINSVWIEEGCIMCNACDAECPEVFQVTDTTCIIKGEVREDGQDTENRDEKSALKPEFKVSLSDAIKAAASGCPVEVIQYQED